MAAEGNSGGVIGNYLLQAPIGQGSSGRVFRGEHRFLHHRVAIKVLHESLLGDRSEVDRFLQEAAVTRSIQHPNIVRALDFGHEPSTDRLYLVMELLLGHCLGSFIAPQKRLDVPLAAFIGGEVADGLIDAHRRGVVHCDLKPSNIFLCVPSGRIKILDFGIARLFAEERPGTVGVARGTPHYMAPEQVRGSRDVGPHSDIYALGVILFRMVTGRLPFDERSSHEVMRRHVLEAPPRPSDLAPVPPEMESLILHCLAKRPIDRPSSIAEVRARLLRLAPNENPLAKIYEFDEAPTTVDMGFTAANLAGEILARSPPRAASRRSRSRKISIVAGAVAAALVLAFASRNRARPVDAEAIVSTSSPHPTIVPLRADPFEIAPTRITRARKPVQLSKTVRESHDDSDDELD